MARIRTIKPSFFRHTGLYDLEKESGLPVRLAFAGLWTAADREGRFKWEPRELKLDCLPHDKVDFSRVLDALATRGFIRKYRVGSVEYGCIPSWHEHQAINNRETASSLPGMDQGIDLTDELTRDARDSDASPTRQVRIQGEGKGREGNMEGKGRSVDADASRRVAPDLDEAVSVWNETATAVGLNPVQRLTPSRRQSLKQRLAECGGIDGFRVACGKVRDSPFLRGENERGWRADFDFVVRQSSFTKLMEGRYDDGNSRSGKYENGFAELLASGQLDGPDRD